MSNKKKICIVAPEIGSGGVEAVLLNYFTHIHTERYEMDLLTYEISNSTRKELFENLGFRILKIPKKRDGFIKSMNAMSHIFKENQYEIVHAHMTMWNCIPMFLAWRWKVPTRISHSHLDVTVQSISTKALLFLQRACINTFSTKLCTCGEDAGRYLYGNNTFNRNRVVVINNAIDERKFKRDLVRRNKVRCELGIEGNTFCIGHIGRFHEHKNHTFLIDIFAEVCKILPDSCLLLIGDGDLKATIEEKVVKRNLKSKVLFLGVRSDPERMYQAMDAFCLPSLFEGLPVVGIEAQAAGLPCIFSTNVSNKVLITKLAQSIELSKPAAYWAKVLIACKGKTSSHPFPKEYDINEMAPVWERLYQ